MITKHHALHPEHICNGTTLPDGRVQICEISHNTLRKIANYYGYEYPEIWADYEAQCTFEIARCLSILEDTSLLQYNKEKAFEAGKFGKITENTWGRAYQYGRATCRHIEADYLEKVEKIQEMTVQELPRNVTNQMLQNGLSLSTNAHRVTFRGTDMLLIPSQQLFKKKGMVSDSC